MRNLLFLFFGIALFFPGCKNVKTDLQYDDVDQRIIFLHHSTGKNVWYGDVDQYKRIRFKEEIAMVPRLLQEYNEKNGLKISIEEKAFPTGDVYPWKNYPYDYYNIWIKNAGEKYYMNEPTLESLTDDYQIIIFKHCFPVSKIIENNGMPNIDSELKTIPNYKLQYEALKTKMYSFPETDFIVWTPAALVELNTTEEQGLRTKDFYEWMINKWDTPNDNIHIFDFYALETEGGIFLKPEYSNSTTDSHPNMKISSKAAIEFSKKIIEVFESID